MGAAAIIARSYGAELADTYEALFPNTIGANNLNVCLKKIDESIEKNDARMQLER